MNDSSNNDRTSRCEALPWPAHPHGDHFTPPTSIDDLPEAFFTIEVKCPDTRNLIRITNAPSRAARRRLERQFRKRKATRPTTRKP